MVGEYEGTIKFEIRCSLCGGHFTGVVHCLNDGKLVCSICIDKIDKLEIKRNGNSVKRV
mgnify:FL=1